MKMRRLVLVFPALACLLGCSNPDSPLNPKTYLKDIENRVSSIEARIIQIEAKQPANNGEWILWRQDESKTNGLMNGYPKAMGGFSTKDECLSSAHGWTFEKSTQVSYDPFIMDTKEWRTTFTCLPKGVSIYPQK
jgi:hypothetical protein